MKEGIGREFGGVEWLDHFMFEQGGRNSWRELEYVGIE